MGGMCVFGEEYNKPGKLFLNVPLEHWLDGVNLEAQGVRGMVLARDSVNLGHGYADGFSRAQDPRAFEPRVKCMRVRGGEVEGGRRGGEEDG